MSPLVVAALAAVLAFQSSLDVQFLDGPAVTSTRLGNLTVSEERRGWTECAATVHPDGRTTARVVRVVAVIPTVDPDTFTHELLHAVDCLDDGQMNGSPLPFSPTWRDAGHEWVFWALTPENQAEAIRILSEVRP